MLDGYGSSLPGNTVLMQHCEANTQLDATESKAQR